MKARVWGGALVVVAWSCGLAMGPVASAAAESSEEVAFRGPFGIGVRPDGSFYVAEIDGRRVSKFDSAGEPAGKIVEVRGYGRLAGPFDVDVSPAGNLIIADTRGHSVLVIGPREELILKLGTGKPSAEPGAFHEPHFVAVNEPAGIIYISDTFNNRIQAFDMQGRLVKTVGLSGHQPGEYHFCGGLCLDDHGRLYAMNWSGGFINAYDADLNFTGSILRREDGGRTFNDAYSIAMQGRSFWVTDTFSSRLRRFSADWKEQETIGRGEGADIHQFNHPTDIDFDAAGNIYVADWKNDRVLKLDPDGSFIRQWGGASATMAYTPPKIFPRDPGRGPIEIGTYSGLSKQGVDDAAGAKVDWIYVSFDNQGGDWGIRPQVDYAHSRGVKVSASIAVYHLGAGDPRWRNRPELYMWKRGGTKPDLVGLSYFHPEVRRWKARHIAGQVGKTGIDGVLLDYIRYPDHISGYEPAMVEAFQTETGRDAAALEPDDPDWLRFRARYITKFICELRYELARLGRPVEVSVYVGPDWESDLKTVIRNWRDWALMGIVDKLVLGIYTRDLASIYEGVRQAREACPDRTRICVMVACWGGNLGTPELLRKGAAAAFAADPDELAVYRGDAIAEFGLWPTIGEIADRYKGPGRETP